jgi:hypothetical protein
VAGDHRQPRRRRAAFDLVELGVAHPAAGDLDQHLARCRLRGRQFHRVERRRAVDELSYTAQQHGLHGAG